MITNMRTKLTIERDGEMVPLSMPDEMKVSVLSMSWNGAFISVRAGVEGLSEDKEQIDIAFCIIADGFAVAYLDGWQEVAKLKVGKGGYESITHASREEIVAIIYTLL